MKDEVILSVIKDLHQRSELGIKKYKTTLCRNELPLRGWIKHAYEESLDTSNYLKRAIMEIDADIESRPDIILLTLENAREMVMTHSIIKKSRVHGSNSKSTYILLENVYMILPDYGPVTIPEGFVWDLSSVPRFLWGVLPPDGDFELASLLHDYLYNTKIVSRKFADDQMLLWSKAVSGTHRTVSIRNFDNQVRYVAVRAFGWYVWNRGPRNNKTHAENEEKDEVFGSERKGFSINPHTGEYEEDEFYPDNH